MLPCARFNTSHMAKLDFDYARVRAALSGALDAGTLSAEERSAFLKSFGDALAQPLPGEEMFWSARRRRGGGVGLDERGQLIWALPSGA